jgi:hypothetical protein
MLAELKISHHLYFFAQKKIGEINVPVTTILYSDYSVIAILFILFSWKGGREYLMHKTKI